MFLARAEEGGGVMTRLPQSARRGASGAEMFEVNEWVGSPLSIQLRAPCALEAHFFVEAQSLSILLVDIGGHVGVQRKAVANERGTKAFSMVGGINEQGLHVTLVDEHECQWMVIGIHSEPERDFGQKVANHLSDGFSVLFGQKAMSGINRAPPDFNRAFAFIGTGVSNGNHLRT